MAVSFGAATTGNTAGVDSSSLTITGPSCSVGNVLYAVVVVNNAAGLTPPDGWTLVDATALVSSTPAGGATYVYRKVAESGDSGASFQWTKSLSQKWVGAIAAFAGGSPSTPEIVTVANSIAGAAAGTTSTTGTAASAVSGQLVADFHAAITDPSGTPSFSAGSGTERADANDGAQGGVEIITGATSAPGSAGTSTISTASAWGNVRVVIAPRFWETPNAPTLVSPVGGVAIVLSEDQVFEHDHSHPDAGDTQSAAQHRYRIVGTSTWTTNTIASGSQTRTVTGGTLVAGNYEWQARTASSLGTYGPWSSSAFFDAVADPDPPVITSHADDDVVGPTEDFTFTLVGTATDVEWRRVADGAGSPNTAVVYDDDTLTGNVRAFTATFDVTGRTEHVQVRATVDGVVTDWESVRVVVTFTPPDEPTHVTTADMPAGAITIAIENPTALDLAGWWAASLYAGSGSFVDQSAGSHDLALPGGSNDPKFLEFAGTKYVYCPPDSGNKLVVPDGAALDITGDIDIRVKVALDDYSPSADHILLMKGAWSYMLVLQTTGLLRLVWGETGADQIVANATADISALAAGSTKWLRATLDVDNGSGGADVKFWTSDDDVTYTQVGATVNPAGGTTSIFASTDDVDIGGHDTSGKIFRAVIKNGIGGSTVLDVDTSVATAAASTFAAVTGQTVTINRAATGRKIVVVDRDLFLFGADDHLGVADHADLDFAAATSFTLFAVVRVHGTPTGTVLAKKAGTASSDVGWLLELNSGTPRARIADGTNAIAASAAGAVTGGAVAVIAVRRSVADDNLTVYIDGAAGTPVTDTTTATLANAEAFRVGRLSGAGTAYGDVELIAAAVVRTALSGAQIAAYTAAVLDAEPVPATDHNDVWRREDGDSDDGIRVAAELAIDADFVDYTVASGQDYQYRVEAIASNGASSFSDWDT